MHSGVKVVKVGRWTRQRSNAVSLLFDPVQDVLMHEETLDQRHAETDAYEKEGLSHLFPKLSELLGWHDSGAAGKPSPNLQWNGHNQHECDNELRCQEAKDRRPHKRRHVDD